MKLAGAPGAHLTYCLNVHPGESWAENFAAIRTGALAVRERVCSGQPFGLGLRLADAAARALGDPAARAEFRRFLADHGLYVFTVNGFPFGAFHGTRVKENVYRPDWRARERADYTRRLADILADLLPAGVTGSISTAPGSYRAWIRDAADRQAMAGQLMDVVAHLDGIARGGGPCIHLGLEPEPDCYLENTADVLAFFEGELAPAGRRVLAPRPGWSAARAEEAIRQHLGVCFDTCHLALQYESLPEALGAMRRAGIRISKVQVSAALRAPMPAARETLRRFCNSVYLHQVKARGADGAIVSRGDLPDALAAAETGAAADAEWRVHCHVPLYAEGAGGMASTADTLDRDFFAAALAAGVEHFEIETYTFDVLPAELRRRGLEASIAAEFDWVLARFAEAVPARA